VDCPRSMCEQLPDMTANEMFLFLAAHCSKGRRQARTLASDRTTCRGS